MGPRRVALKALLKRLLPTAILDRLRFAKWRVVKTRYSFEGEDVIAAFVLDRSMAGRTGTYLDIGANHPIHNSNTYWFYERGWRGVCVDPTPGFAADYQRLRPRDRFMNVGAGTAGTLQFHRFEESQYNTFSSDMADGHQAAGIRRLASLSVDVLPVMTLLERAGVGPETIDLFSLDVEGHELAVLDTIDWTRFRPQVIVIEMFAPTLGALLALPAHAVLDAAGYDAVSKLHNSAIYVRR